MIFYAHYTSFESVLYYFGLQLTALNFVYTFAKKLYAQLQTVGSYISHQLLTIVHTLLFTVTEV